DPGTALAGTWTAGSGTGYHNTYAKVAAGNGSATASWTLSGLTPGATYQIAATWPGGLSGQSFLFANNATFTILDGNTPTAVLQRSQRFAPNEFSDGGFGWSRLGTYLAHGTSLTVQLSNLADGTVIADAVRVQQVSGDGGGDDNFHLAGTSPAIDRADPATP